jgi:two-component system nitrogen regulation response regulator GlnG
MTLPATEPAEEDKPFTEIVRKHVQAYYLSHGDSLPSSGVYARLLPLVEKPLIETTLEVTAGNQLKAAKILGINRNTLRKKIKELDIKTRREP